MTAPTTGLHDDQALDPDPFTIGLGIFSAIAGGARYLAIIWTIFRIISVPSTAT